MLGMAAGGTYRPVLNHDPSRNWAPAVHYPQIDYQDLYYDCGAEAREEADTVRFDEIDPDIPEDLRKKQARHSPCAGSPRFLDTRRSPARAAQDRGRRRCFEFGFGREPRSQKDLRRPA